jgi:hypothetical protein
MERCVGCETQGEQPIVGIGLESPELKSFEITTANERGFVAYGVCRPCHEDPAHRHRVLKLSFFERSQSRHALKNAGSNSIGGR